MGGGVGEGERGARPDGWTTVGAGARARGTRYFTMMLMGCDQSIAVLRAIARKRNQ
jgi:hypothetical protein